MVDGSLLHTVLLWPLQAFDPNKGGSAEHAPTMVECPSSVLSLIPNTDSGLGSMGLHLFYTAGVIDYISWKWELLD